MEEYNLNDILKIVNLPSIVNDCGKRCEYNSKLNIDSEYNIFREKRDRIGGVIKIPEGVQVIENFAFSGCSNIKKVIIPNSVKSIKRAAFSDCLKMEEVEILGNNLLEIYNFAFYNCESLRRIHIPNSVRMIGKGVFMKSGLEVIQIPDGIRELRSILFTVVKI